MPLGTEIDLGPGDIVLDEDLDPPTARGTTSPAFRPMSTVAITAELLYRFAA